MTDEPFGGIGKKYNEEGGKRDTREETREGGRGNINIKNERGYKSPGAGLFRDLCGVYASSFESHQLPLSLF